MLTFLSTRHKPRRIRFTAVNEIHCPAKNVQFSVGRNCRTRQAWHFNACYAAGWRWPGCWLLNSDFNKCTNVQMWTYSTRGDGRRVPFDVEIEQNENKIGRSSVSSPSNHTRMYPGQHNEQHSIGVGLTMYPLPTNEFNLKPLPRQHKSEYNKPSA